jgi:S1-C subfamily serine protease
VDVVDVVLVVLVVAAALHGLRLGALVQILTYVGFFAGLVLGALLSLAVVSPVRSPVFRTFMSLALVLGMAVAGGLGGRVLGDWSNVTLRRLHLGSVDAAAGVAVAVVAVLLSAWVLSNVLVQSRYTWLSSAIQRSAVLRTVDNVMPPVPSVFARVQGFLESGGFPPVFANLAALPAGPVAEPTSAQATALGRPAAASTVKVLGVACGYEQEGSGFVVAPGMVVTNAHVVAGERSTDVVVGGSAYRATPVYVDPSFDLAVLRTPAPLGPPLPLDPDVVDRGTTAAVVGYPENQSLTITPAGVSSLVTAEGRDIYNSGLVVRQVYEVDAHVLPGNSGGPLVGPGGQVLGVVFSRSTVDANVGYALTSPEVASRVRVAAGAQRAVSTGACTEG